MPASSNADSRSHIRSFLSILRGVVTSGACRAAAPHKAALGRLWEMPLTLIGIGCVDYAAFLTDQPLGWLVTGLSAMGVEFLIADGDA